MQAPVSSVYWLCEAKDRMGEECNKDWLEQRASKKQVGEGLESHTCGQVELYQLSASGRHGSSQETHKKTSEL